MIDAEFNADMVLAALLGSKGLGLCVAESFTGGYLTSLLTAINGCSDYLRESIVCYSPQSKIRRLNVNEKSIEQHGVVSAQVCREMLEGLLACDGCDVAIATTGYAVPSDGEQFGFCFLGAGWAGNGDIECVVKSYVLKFDRKGNIREGARLALELAVELINKKV